MPASAAPQHKKLEIPDTTDWQLADYVQFLYPYSEQIKINHQHWRKATDPTSKNTIGQKNKLLLSFLNAVLEHIPKQRDEAVVISDLHFGIRFASDLEVLVFLHSINPEYLFLNGDIIDFQVIKSRHDINPIQREAIRRIRRMKENGECQVVRLRGNHDPMSGWEEGKPGYAGIPVYKDLIYLAEDGSRTLITHGDRFDKIVGSKGKLEKFGSQAYDLLVLFNHYHKKFSRRCHIPHFSIARALKVACKLICMKMSHFDDMVFSVAERCDADFILCGHTHIYMHEERGGREYINSADWVETCAALIKPPQGRWQLVRPMQRKEHPGYIHPRQERRPHPSSPKPVILPAYATAALQPALLHRHIIHQAATVLAR